MQRSYGIGWAGETTLYPMKKLNVKDGGYSISDKADDEFREMFGLSADGEERLKFGNKQEDESNPISE